MTLMPDSRPGVIFDVDGVLVDSSTAHYHSWLALADECDGHRMSEAEFDATFGRTSREIIAELWPGEPLSPSRIAELDNRKEELYRELLQVDFRAIAGAAELITELKATGFGVAAGSSGPPENVLLVLDQLQRRDLFDAVITAVDVSRGKPHPEVFLNCARGLQLPPECCAVIEDALVGVAAANTAGCLSIAFVSPRRDATPFTVAHHVVRDLADLSPDQIRHWLANHPRC